MFRVVLLVSSTTLVKMVASWIPGVVLLYMGMSAFFSQELGLLELGDVNL